MIFLYPDFLLFMVLPLIVLGFFIITNKKQIDRFFPKNILEKLILRKNYLGLVGKNILLFGAMFLFILALARPIMPKNELNLQKKQPVYAILLDISASMKAKDIYPNRLEFAKRKIELLLKKSTGIVSLYAFSDKLYEIAPPTKDMEVLVYLIKHLKVDKEFSNSSDLKNALKNIKEKTVIIFTDGTEVQDFSFIKDLDKDIVVYLTATQKGTCIKKDNHYINDKNQNIVISKANQKIYNLGRVYHFSYKNEDVYNLTPSYKVTKKDFYYLDKKELFYYPLAVAFLLLFLAFYRLKGFKISLILVMICIIPKNSHAFGLDFVMIENATKAYHDGEYEKSTKLFKKLVKEKGSPESFYNLANSLYKQKEYDLAVKNYKRVKTTDPELKYKVYFNLANSLFRLKHYQKANLFYHLAENIKPTNKVKKNLMLVSKYIDIKKQNKFFSTAVKTQKSIPLSKIKIKTFMIPLTKSKKSLDENPW